MDFDGWKKQLENEGISYKNEPLGPYLAFYINETVDGRIDYSKLFNAIESSKAASTAKVVFERTGEREYDLTVTVPPAIKINIDINPTSFPDEGQMLEYAEDKLKEMYEDGLAENQNVKKRLEQIREIKNALEAVNYGMQK